MTILTERNTAATQLDFRAARTMVLGSSILLGYSPILHASEHVVPFAPMADCAVPRNANSASYLAAIDSSQDERTLSEVEAGELRRVMADKTARPKIEIKQLPKSL